MIREKRELIFEHIKSNSTSKGFFIDAIGGFDDHVHILMSLKADWSISKHMQMIKGESANWINKTKLFKEHFEWGSEYFASSVSENKLGYVRTYIAEQEEHHRKITFEEEYNFFIKSLNPGQG